MQKCSIRNIATFHLFFYYKCVHLKLFHPVFGLRCQLDEFCTGARAANCVVTWSGVWKRNFSQSLLASLWAPETFSLSFKALARILTRFVRAKRHCDEPPAENVFQLNSSLDDIKVRAACRPAFIVKKYIEYYLGGKKLFRCLITI